MSHPDWTVAGALAEVIAEIAAGAQPLALEPGTRRALEDLYRPDFEERWNLGADWSADRDEVLSLARLVGLLASGLTLGRIASGGTLPTQLPIPVDTSAAVGAAKLVAKYHCREPRPSSGPVILRRWCKSVGDGATTLPAAPTDPLAALIDALTRRTAS